MTHLNVTSGVLSYEDHVVPGLSVEQGRDGGHAHGDAVLVPKGHEEEALHDRQADDVASGALVAQ